MNEQEEQLSPEEEHAKLFEALEGKTDEQPKAVEPKVEAKEEPEPEQEADEPFAGFNSLPEETRELVLQQIEAERAKAQELDQRYRQQHGQLAPVQRKVAELERQNVNLLKHLDELQRARATELQGKSTDAFAKYKEMYPDEAEAHEARYAPLELQNKALLEEQRRTKESLDSIKYEIDLQKNSALVVKQHPDAYDILQDPVFEAWVSALDEDDQARANSSKASDAVKILDQFKRDKMLSELLDAQKSPTQPSRNKPRLDVDPTPRNRQSPAPQRAGNASGSEEEEYAAFAEAYEADPKMFQRTRR